MFVSVTVDMIQHKKLPSSLSARRAGAFSAIGSVDEFSPLGVRLFILVGTVLTFGLTYQGWHFTAVSTHPSDFRLCYVSPLLLSLMSFLFKCKQFLGVKARLTALATLCSFAAAAVYTVATCAPTSAVLFLGHSLTYL